ncbi:hypothetical protein DPV78_000636 [Talaromyces pinophilus]|nr:hypothetical protein DPV78_000636 [Talaromyces pinophilus]
MTTATLRQPRQNASSIFALKSNILASSMNININMNASTGTSNITQNTRMKLEIETRQLQRSWKEFQESLRYQEQKQQPEDLIREMRAAIDYWSAHRQRVLFRKSIKWAQECLGTMDGHVILMQALPDPKRYCELFFGVVYSIVRAAREQYRVAEAFLKFLARINHAVTSAVQINSTTEMVATLYSQIFLFLGEFLRDYVTKACCRLLYSHNEDFKSNFNNLVTSVENLATMRLESAPESIDCADSKACVALNHVDHARLEKVGLEGDARRHASQTTTVWQLIWNQRQQKLLNDKLAAEQTRILEAFLASLQAQVHQIEIDAECHRSGNCGMLPPSTKGRNTDKKAVHKTTRALDSSKTSPKRRLLKVILQQDSSPLQDYFDNNEQIYPFGRDQRLEISSSIAKALFDWTQTNPSLPLAIEGSQPLGLPGRLTLVSACYITVARKRNIPVISHFCASSPRTDKKAGLIALVYSLIRQLIELVPPMLDCDSNCDLSGERFRRLNGTIGSWNDALAILDTLLRYTPPVLFCVIDALDVLEEAGDEALEQYVRGLVTTLSSHNTRLPTSAPPQTPAVTVTTTTTTTTTTNADTPNPGNSTSGTSTTTTTSSDQAPSPSPNGLFKVLFTTAGKSKAVQEMFVDQGLGQVITTMDTEHVRAVDAAPSLAGDASAAVAEGTVAAAVDEDVTMADA